MTEKIEQYRQLAVRIVEKAPQNLLVVLEKWTKQLAAVEKPDLTNWPAVKKSLKQVYEATAEGGKQLAPVIREITKSIKKYAWDERSIPARWTIGSMMLAIATTGGQGAGIAAMGSAVGVALWVVFGAGGAFIGVLHKEVLDAIAKKSKVETEYSEVIEAKKIEKSDGHHTN